VPLAYDRVLATQFGVRAFEMVLEGRFGEMVSYQHPHITSVPLKDAISQHNYVSQDSDLIKNARGVGISFGN
jgi:6-phosphofructokinase 1